MPSRISFPFALASTVAAQCSNSETYTITASADASQVASCTVYSGSIAVPTDISDATDSNGRNSLSIDGVQRIVGNVTINNAANLAELSFPELTSIQGLQLGGLTVLSSLSLPSIQEIRQLNLTALPALQDLAFGDGVTQARSVLITNTGLSSLRGLDQLESVDSFNVNNNAALQNISLSVTSIKNAINIAANADFQNGVAISFPELVTARNMTFRNCSSVSLPSLANVTEYLGFYGNTMETFSARNLTTTGGLVFVDNTELTNITLPELVSVNGSFQIANNTQLKKIDGIQKLATVIASIDLNGNFSEVDFPNLTQVRGTFNLQTSAEFDCSGFDSAKKSKGIIRGNPYVCRGSLSKPGGTGSKVSSGSAPSDTSAADVNAINYQTIIGGTSLLAGVLQWIL